MATVGSPSDVFCSVSTGCGLLTHDTVKWASSGGKLPYDYERTQMGDCFFIGAHAMVAKGLTIGNHCLIGAGAVVTRDVDDFTIAGGVPTRSIGRVELDPSGNVHLVYNTSQEKNKSAK